MSQKIFITGSSDGLGLLAAKALTSRGHSVYLHGRNAQRSKDAQAACPAAKGVLTADLSSLEETKHLALELNKIGPLDAIVYSAGLYKGVSGLKGKEGFPALFAVNVLAPYVLSCLVDPPAKRMVFLSSGFNHSGSANLKGSQLLNCGYPDSKLYNIMMANAFARKYGHQGVVCNALDPGWVPTKMGGARATGNIDLAVKTYEMLALGVGDATDATGQHWYQCRLQSCNPEALNESAQEVLLAELAKISGIDIPSKQ